jgi:hypothetical protein
LLAGDASPLAQPPQRRRRAERARSAAAANAPATIIAAPPPDESPTSLAAAIAAVEAAVDALSQAGRQAPARYDVAVGYRLDALAHHLQQVMEFVASLADRSDGQAD